MWNVCSRDCGFCGRCTSGPRVEAREMVGVCDWCGTTFMLGGVSREGLGTFCNHDHKNQALAFQAAHAARKSA